MCEKTIHSCSIPLPHRIQQVGLAVVLIRRNLFLKRIAVTLHLRVTTKDAQVKWIPFSK